jgi:hypothetical protein
MENSHKSLAKKLGIPRTSYIRYLKAGMSLDLDEAREWLAENKPERSRIAIEYPSKPVEGGSSEARFDRLKASEKYLAEQIAGIQETTLPDLVSRLSDCGTDKERVGIEKALAQVSRDLLGLRKEHRTISKTISDIELKKESLTGGMVPVGFMIDSLTKCLTPAFSFARNLSHGMADKAEAAKIDGISSSIVKALQDSIKNLITELRGVVPVGYDREAVLA